MVNTTTVNYMANALCTGVTCVFAGTFSIPYWNVGLCLLAFGITFMSTEYNLSVSMMSATFISWIIYAGFGVGAAESALLSGLTIVIFGYYLFKPKHNSVALKIPNM